MTGTSMDGIDISLVKTNGLDLLRFNQNYFYEYSINTKRYLLSLLNEDLTVIKSNKNKLDELITNEHCTALLKFDNILIQSQYLAFHGQTIYHNASENISIQLGDGNQLGKRLKKDVIFDFRSNDINNGGEGAPLAPIYHQYLINHLNLTFPSCVLNIGGVANISFWDGKQLIGFDTGPGNGLMDSYIKLKTGYFFDRDGNLASQGKVRNEIIIEFLKNPYFNKKYPKSLDRNSFKHILDKIIDRDFDIYDSLATLAECTIVSISKAIQSLPHKPKNIILVGGGYKNNHLLRELKKRLNINFILQKDVNFSFDYVESEMMAFLGARTINNLPSTFPLTTGVKEPLKCGRMFKYQ